MAVSSCICLSTKYQAHSSVAGQFHFAWQVFSRTATGVSQCAGLFGRDGWHETGCLLTYGCLSLLSRLVASVAMLVPPILVDHTDRTTAGSLNAGVIQCEASLPGERQTEQRYFGLCVTTDKEPCANYRRAPCPLCS